MSVPVSPRIKGKVPDDIAVSRISRSSMCRFPDSILVNFLLYSRSYCHLCEDMLAALRALEGEYDFSVDIVDVDADEDLVARFDELVPVLFASREGGEAIQLCNYFLDESKVRAFLRLS